MKLAIMQPYLFPYIGYFQLIYAADLFLIYDDVAYIKQGYINRNSIMSANGAARFTISVPGASSNKLISELTFSGDVAKVLKTIDQSYSKAPHFEDVFPVIRGILELEDRSIASVCQKSFKDIFSYLGIEKQFKKTSELQYNRSDTARDRLIALCHQFGADCYINAPGGRKLYAKPEFAEQGINLKFVDSLPIEYFQGAEEFVPNLSIIDMLMNCPPSQVIAHIEHYELG
ncbi:WbqC family protein [Vreelandella venusta]|uniref:WbqC family protein n=1 Tax=Vreelandella venusta TaxID=44935 RepID=UPI0038511E40